MSTETKHDRCTVQEIQAAEAIANAITAQQRALTKQELSKILNDVLGRVPSIFEENGLIPAIVNFTRVDEALRDARTQTIMLVCSGLPKR